MCLTVKNKCFSLLFFIPTQTKLYVVAIYHSLHRKQDFVLSSDLWSFVKVYVEVLPALQHLPPAKIIV